MFNSVQDIINENNRRLQLINAPFNPVSGFNSVGDRVEVRIPDFPIPSQWLPSSMLSIPLVKEIISHGSLKNFILNFLNVEYNDISRAKVIDAFVRLRSRYDFPFWAAVFVKIQSKIPGQGEIPFFLTRPQRKFVAALEQQRLANRPIRIILLKARQWGGSTTSQLYMAWLQLVHKVSLNSVIVSQTKKTSFAIKAMYDRALNAYPVEMLYPQGTPFNPDERKMENVGLSSDYKRIPQRDCTITIASYEAPDALRGDSYSLVHCSEVALWHPTDLKSPDSVVRSACSGILLKPYTMVIYESTPNGTGNFFYNEYQAAKNNESQFIPLFISWFDIDLYQAEINDDDLSDFASSLLNNRNVVSVPSRREEPGQYLWWLWEKGATLQAIKWYIAERAGKDSHAVMASEYPTDDIEAFVHSGSMVFDKYKVEALKLSCIPPTFVGEVVGHADAGAEAFKNLRFSDDAQGYLSVWNLPEIDADEIIENRYLVVVDIGGRSDNADWSVICVFDRLFMADGGKPQVVAQWRGHVDHDILAWKAAQIAAFYDFALLVIESNTLETKDRSRDVDGDQSLFILNQIADVYPNLYTRSAPEDVIVEGVPKKYGFHTNVNTKPMVISTLVKMVRDNLFVERDALCIHELLCYEKKQNGAFGAIKNEHDDILMTRAIGLHISAFEMPLPKAMPRAHKHLSKNRSAVSAATF